MNKEVENELKKSRVDFVHFVDLHIINKFYRLLLFQFDYCHTAFALAEST